MAVMTMVAMEVKLLPIILGLLILVDTGFGQGKVEAGEQQAIEEKGPLRNGGLEDGI